MASHVSDTWLVSTCIEHGMSIKWDGDQFVVGERNKKERKERKRRKKKKKKDRERERGVPMVRTRRTKK